MRKLLCVSILLFVLSACVRSESELRPIRVEKAEEDLEILRNSPSLSGRVLTFEDIMGRVLDRNLDITVKKLEYEYQYELATGAKLKMIPPLVVTGELSGRNRNTGSSSKSLDPGVPPAPPSISSEQHVNRYDLTFTWNLLDFGISFFRARQAADKTIIKQMEYLRAQQRLIQDVVEEYWKARTALLGLTKSRDLLAMTNELKAFMTDQMEKQILPKDKTLYQERQILRQEIQIQLFEKEYHKSMEGLAKFMGSPCADFDLVQEELSPINLDLPCPDELGRLALLNRPELFGLDMEEEAVSDEAIVALLQIFPSLSPFIGRFFDSNFYLIYHRWIYGGLRYTWNLLAVPYHLQDYLSELRHEKVTQFERLAVSIGVLTQVNLSWITYQDSKQEYELVQNLADLNRDLLQATESRELYGEMSALEVLIDYKYEALLSEVEALRSYGYLQGAISQINTSIGIPFYIQSIYCLDSYE